jgi:hypothetical protein
MPHSGNPKSAVVKKPDLSAPNVVHRWCFGSQSLLCKGLRSPIELSISTVDHRLASQWRPARLLLEQHRLLDAIATLAALVQQPTIATNIRIPTMFLLAQMHIENADSIRAEQCIQRGLRALSQSTFFPRDWNDSARIQSSIQREMRPYSLSFRDWLTLAIQALTQGDLESALRWIDQADRALSRSTANHESPELARQMGDLHAVLACAMVHNQCYEEAEKCLVTAYRQHIDGSFYESACRDLILTSRLATIEGQAERSLELLDAAECQLIMALPSDAADSSPLADAIYADRYAESAAG